MVPKIDAVFKAFWLARMTKKGSEDAIKNDQKNFDNLSSKEQDELKEQMKPLCEEFYETDAYKNGDKDVLGYKYCCDTYGFCGGLSGWWIFFIIVIVLLVLAGAGAALWFFYLKRKLGGSDETNEKDLDVEESSTKRDNSYYDISIDTY